MVKRKYFTFNQAKKLYLQNFKDIDDTKLQRVIVKLRDYVRYTEDTLTYRNILLEGGYFKNVVSPSASGVAPRDIWMVANLKNALDEALKEKEKRSVA